MTKFKHVAKSNPEPNVDLSPIMLVSIFLQKNGRSRRSFIERSLEEQTGKKYFDHKGLDYILGVLIKKGIIRKLAKEPGRQYPEYELTPKGMNDISLEANFFASEATIDLLNYKQLESQTLDSFLEGTVKKIGVYTVFSYIQGLKRTSIDNSPKDNTELFDSWLRNTLPMRSVSNYLQNAVDYLCPSRNEQPKNIFYDENKRRFLYELEKRLGELFPNETKRYKTIIGYTKKGVEEGKQFDKEIMEHAKWVRMCDKRNTKYPKKKLEPNECPRCHYDGTVPVPKGPSKGVIFKNGFALRTIKNRLGRLCYVCGFWQDARSG